jgi:hypothetical protein
MAKKIVVTFGAFLLRQRFELMALGVAHDLDAFAGEISFEAGEGEAGAINRRFANDPAQTFGAADQIQSERALVFGVETLNGDNVALHGHAPHPIVGVVSITGKMGQFVRAKSTADWSI